MFMTLANLTQRPIQRMVVENVLKAKVPLCVIVTSRVSCGKYHSHTNNLPNNSSVGNKPSRNFDSNHQASLNEILIDERNMARRMVLETTSTGPVEQKYDYLLVLDFEATCDNKEKLNPQEIIEFPVLKFNVRSQKVEAVFHQYVSPQYHPQLTPFCTELTGIVQDMVTDQPTLPEVLRNFDKWMITEGLIGSETTSTFVTCGDWDLKTMLPKQCALLDIAPKPYFQRWINIKKSYADVTGTFPKGMMDMMVHFGLKHKGRQHSGIDDCRNISSIVAAILNKGYVFRENGRL
ncbi:unnamed protein product [Candidula unifasciata]|uniref:Exonuclease domain-containing protein n=1 Tax=Candidula unifasciata TaxID=100452 RepID=A0A8S3YJ51_9EUPU|nr:unnamed protein product [Candidula unifasciata]